MHLSDIFRHPVKSLGAEPMCRVSLSSGQGVPHDRRYAIAHGKSDFDRTAPAWAPCRNFLRIANFPTLAAFDVRFDALSETLTLCGPAGSAAFDLSTAPGRDALLQFVEPLVAARAERPFCLAQVPGVGLTDSPEPSPSLMSRATLRALEEKMGQALDLRRFRGNFWIEGGRAWQELELIGRVFTIGAVRFRGLAPIVRCLAPAANPQTGHRDCNPLRALADHFGVREFGVTIEVLSAGEIKVSQSVALDDAP